MSQSIIPFMVGELVRYQPDPDHVEKIIRCLWAVDADPPCWRVVTEWCEGGRTRRRVALADEFEPVVS